MKLTILIVLTILLLMTNAFADDVTLEWTKNTEPNLAGYTIFYDTNSEAPYEGVDADQGPSPLTIPLADLDDAANPEYTLTGLDYYKDHFFTVKTYDNKTPPNESDFSNEVSSPGYMMAPTLRIKKITQSQTIEFN